MFWVLLPMLSLLQCLPWLPTAVGDVESMYGITKLQVKQQKALVASPGTI